jgi:hypothetical protein
MTSPAASSAAAAQLAVLTKAFKELFSTTFIGFSIATALYGISVLQAYLYFRRYTKDRWTLKTMVATLCALDTLTTIFVAHSLFLFVLGFINRKLDLNIPWSFTAEKLLVTIITFIAQCFYAHTIWKFSEHIFTTAFVSILAVGTFGLGIYTTVHLFENPALTSISTREFLIVSGLVQGLAALNDITITGSMSYFLHARRTGLASSDKLIDTLVLYGVSIGVLTAITQIMFLVLNVALPHHQYWLPFHMAVGKLYVNSVLATLNVRGGLSQSEVQLGHLSRVESDGEGDQMRTKPITFAVIGRGHSVFTVGTVSRGSGDAEQG